MNNNFEMPSLKKNEEESKQGEQIRDKGNNNQEKIEIPQEYYDKLNKEKEERLQQLAKKEEDKETTKQSGSTIFLIIINLIIIFGLLYAMLHYNRLILLGIPVYLVIGTLISGVKNKENSKFGVSLLVGCMAGALLGFVLAMNNKTDSDSYIYYAYAFFIVAFLGYVLSTAILKVFYDKNVKALGKIFCLMVVVLVLGGPYYFYTSRKDDFMKYVFREDGVVGASSEKEYAEKTLKNRYGNVFICDGSKKNYIDDITHRRLSIIGCHSTDNAMELEVRSTLYNEDTKQYIIKDNYLDEKYIKPLKQELINDIKGIIPSNSVAIGIYPDNKCYFIGDCENDHDYQSEMNLNNLQKYSEELRLKDYLDLSPAEFFNKYSFEYNIVIRGNYSSSEDFVSFVNKIAENFDNKGLKNTKGFTITIKDNSVVKDVFKVGAKTKTDSFKDYQAMNG